MRFLKFHGYGNDYLVFEETELAGVASLNEFARRVCERHYGAGADGIAVVGELAGADAAADFSLRIFNHDGSEAAMSGNGSRCAAAYLYERALWTREELRFQTLAGVKLYRLRARPQPGRYRFEAEIGRPRFDSPSIPFRAEPAPLPEVRAYPLVVPGGEVVTVTALQMCNPNCCVFVEDFEATDWRRMGRAIESHRQFPEKTNVEFVRVRDRQRVEARVWERGVGETLSSGTGACAAAVASMLNGLVEREVSVNMPGGLLEVLWRNDGEVLLTGDAELVYTGDWPDERVKAEG
ncbi:MAG TPA: diaminopimelate epimerase [Pyrinomonadaceae bacterium]|nr:diaminopimelate epimerase [Pyrinomonadaceae bacterium]